MEAMKRLSNLLWFASALLAISIWTRTAMAAPVQLNIKVIYAHSKSKLIDPKLKDLAKQFSKLKFTAYELKDEGSYTLDIGASGSLQLPGGEWMKVIAKEMTPEGMLRLDLVVDKPRFRSTAIIAAGATLAVSGPKQESGSLILAVTRPKN